MALWYHIKLSSSLAEYDWQELLTRSRSGLY